jgi:hypothetical protein
MDKPKDPRAKEQFHSLNPVAIRAGQKEVNAPEHETWGIVTCDQCGEKFHIGPHRIYPEQADEYVKRFEEMLADEHRRGNAHKNSYDLGW